MAREIPEVVRAVAGLAATVLDEVRKLPATLPGLPVRLIGLVMQQAMKVQQHYAGLVARGDEVFTGVRGEKEPGLATFDEDLEPAPATAPGFRDSAFDRATVAEADRETAGTGAAGNEPTADVSTSVDVLTAEGEVATVDATVTDEGVAAPEGRVTGEGTVTATDEGGTPVAAATGVRTDVGETGTAEEDAAMAEGAAVDAVGAGSAAPTDDPQGGSELSGAQAAGTAPVEGYDGFSIAQLRGRLRGYQPTTVRDLLAYEEATRARAPYLTMLRNRLEKVAAES